VHLANASIDLETHIQDMLGVIQFEDPRDIVLLGHSYGGMVATGVADRVRDRIAQLIYLDAFVPEDGQSLLERRRTRSDNLRSVQKTRRAGVTTRSTPAIRRMSLRRTR
jgi:pimeloyl-ACP methyl ester carboxylesterase